MGWQAEVIANIFFSICKAWKIYCEDNGAVPGSLSPSYHHFRKLGAVIGVKLEPEGAAGCIGDFLKAAGCNRTGRHEGPRHASSLGGCALAFRMCHALVGCRRYENGHTHRRTQDSSAEFEVTYINEHARTKPDALEDAAVGPQRYLVVAPPLVEIPGGRFYTSLSERFIFIEIDWFHKGFLLVQLLLTL